MIKCHFEFMTARYFRKKRRFHRSGYGLLSNNGMMMAGAGKSAGKEAGLCGTNHSSMRVPRMLSNSAMTEASARANCSPPAKHHLIENAKVF